MQFLFKSHSGKHQSSPLEGLPAFRAQQAEAAVKHLARREWWIWFSAAVVTVLAAVAFSLTAIHSFFLHADHFYELRPEQVRWGVLSLLLLFNGWMVYQQWSIRRLRRDAVPQDAEANTPAASISGSPGLDTVTGLLTRAAMENQLGKEIARARRQNTALSVATLHLDDVAELIQRYGKPAVDDALKEFARRLKDVSRGSDFAVRLANEDFLLVLPKCTAGEVSRVLNRVGPVEVTCSGKRISLAYTTGWVDYQPVDLPADLIKRATQLLHLYENAAKDSAASAIASR
jgi:diguanylate cyclase (GGDEF)-like protein